eukprot:TRINITY_DN2774_c0_g1_i1.p1 TRINITY_DN2774_c0_g1~~TRINITY_DN2774_c0_g1_i1.p1  ORF type:complete len:143 (-),score=34.52 TRINITY_DN2774_c0_g1_i1:13-441(-)
MGVKLENIIFKKLQNLNNLSLPQKKSQSQSQQQQQQQSQKQQQQQQQQQLSLQQRDEDQLLQNSRKKSEHISNQQLLKLKKLEQSFLQIKNQFLQFTDLLKNNVHLTQAELLVYINILNLQNQLVENDIQRLFLDLSLNDSL